MTVRILALLLAATLGASAYGKSLDDNNSTLPSNNNSSSMPVQIDAYSMSLGNRLMLAGINVSFEYFLKSPNYNERRYGPLPEFIVEHYTVSPTVEATMAIFLNPASQVSAHFVVGQNGTCYFLIPVYQRAWHAGVGGYVFKDLAFRQRLTAPTQDVYPMNSLSVGIENVNSGDEPFTDEQVNTNVELVRQLVIDFDIPEENIIGHGDYSYRKIDPGPYFHTVWEKLGKTSHKLGRSLALYSYVNRHKHPKLFVNTTGTVVNATFDVAKLQSDLQSLGYPTGDDGQNVSSSNQVNENTRNAILEFTLRYMGKEVVEDATLKAAYDNLWASSTSGTDVGLLKVWTSNHQRILDDLLKTTESAAALMKE